MKDSMSIPPSAPPEKEMYYPTLYLEWDDDYELPDSGTMTIRFKKAAETNEKRDGKESQRVTLDVHEIISVKGKKADKDEESGADALDRLKGESEKDYDEGE